MAVINFLLQSILIIGHLQSSSLEFFHGDYKPDNVFVTKCTPTQTRYFKFNIFGKEMKVKNMGFAVLIADFDKSSITIKSEINNLSNNKYRLIPPIVLKPLLGNYVNDLIKNYGDVDPDFYEGDIKINKVECKVDKDLIFYLKKNLQVNVDQKAKLGYIIKINTSKNISSVTKDTSGANTEEQITVNINLKVLNSKDEEIGSDSINGSRVVSVTNDFTQDTETNRIETSNIIASLSKDLTFSIRSKIIQDIK